MYRIFSLIFGISLVWSTVPGGELQFSLAPNFFDEKPGSEQLGPCHGGVVIDKAGNIYVSTDTERGLVIFSPQGKFVRACGPSRIHGLEIREESGMEYIYAARPTDHEVVKLKLDEVDDGGNS